MRRARLEGQAQRLAGAEQMRLADHFVKTFRPQQLGQRRMRGGGKQVGHEFRRQRFACRRLESQKARNETILPSPSTL